eukprot:PhM_4_TR10962/c0_g1_i1/m.85532
MSNGQWTEATAVSYAASTNNPFMFEMNQHIAPFILNAMEEVGDAMKKEAVLIDVGCGACTLLSRIGPMTPPGVLLVGVDLNPAILKYGASTLPPETAERTVLLEGNCTELADVLNSDSRVAALLRSEDVPRVVCCCGNTIGILPEPVRHACLVNMLRLLRSSNDLFILQSYDKDQMRKGFEEFYARQPGLVGKEHVTEENFDFEKGVFYVPESGYRSQWYNPTNCGEMLAAALADVGNDVQIDFTYEQKVNGLFVAGRRR